MIAASQDIKRVASLLLLCLLLISCSETPEKIYQRLDMQAENFVAEKNYSQALASWDKLVNLQPESPEIYLKIGKTSLLTAQYHKALQAFLQFLKQQPTAVETWLQVTRIHLVLGDIYAAEQSLNNSGKFKKTESGMILHGDLLAAQKKYPAAEKKYREVVEKNPQNQTGLARLALILIGQNKKDEAENYFAALTALQPKSAAILLQMGNFWLLAGNSNKASRYFRRAVAQNPDDLNLQIRLAMFHVNHKQYGQAITVIKPLLEQFPANRFVKKIFIESLLLSGQLAEAEKMLNGLAGTEVNDLDFCMLKGKYYFNILEIHTAVSQFMAVVGKEPKLPLGHYLLSLAYLAGGQNMLAQKSLIKCLTLNPNFTEAELALADSYYKNKKYDLALEHVERIIKREPENCRPHLIKGNIMLAQKKYDTACENFQSANIINQGLTAPANYFCIAASLHSGDIKKALRLSRILLETKPESVDGLLQYILILVKEGKSNEAIKFLKKSINRQAAATTPYLYTILAMLYQEDGQKTKAASTFHKALTVNPSMKTAYIHLFDLYADDPQKLEKTLTTAIANINMFTEAYVRLASIYCETHQPQKAIDLLEKSLTADPESAQLANNLAWLYVEYQPKDIDEAMRLARKAYEKLPDNPATADTLGWIYYKKNMPTRAGWLLEQAYKLDPDNPHINKHLKAIKQGL